MLDATDTEGRRFETGDVVYGRPLIEGKRLNRRKGVVLGPFIEDDTKRVVVWWYNMGFALEASRLMWNDELSHAGDIFDMSARQARTLYEGAALYPRARFVRTLLANHVARMAKLGAQHPVK